MIRKYRLYIAVLIGFLFPMTTSCEPEEQYEVSRPGTSYPSLEQPDEEENEGENGTVDNTDDKENSDMTDNTENKEENDTIGNSNESMENRNISVKIGNETFTVTLDNNEAAAAFAELLPITIGMNELNGNEKYGFLPQNLPINSYRPDRIEEGDLMLYGSNCIVLFYESFSNGYSYTRLGRIQNAAGLKRTVGGGNITVTFE